ncbi:MAG: hypothetical protein JWM64_1477 [Frankiales bacterium]|nr:hypothetical protein [Frankiales bacterium]
MRPSAASACPDLPALARGQRVRLHHGHVTLPDGHEVGVTVGGMGVPLVFLHGIGLSRRTYVRVLNRLPQLGFLVVALDAADHGETGGLPRGQATFGQRVDLTLRALDALGISRAVFVGHSMGGRMAAELAGRDPARSIALVLVDAALGSTFDDSRGRIDRPWLVARALAEAVYDSSRDRTEVGADDRKHYRRVMTGSMRSTVLRPWRFRAAAQAVATARPSGEVLEQLRQSRVPTVVVHGGRDLIVPLSSAQDVVDRTGASMVVLPEAYHSWLLPNPYSFTSVMADLVRNEVGLAVRRELSAHGVAEPVSPLQTMDALLGPDAAVRRMLQPVEPLGPARPPLGVTLHAVRRA